MLQASSRSLMCASIGCRLWSALFCFDLCSASVLPTDKPMDGTKAANRSGTESQMRGRSPRASLGSTRTGEDLKTPPVLPGYHGCRLQRTYEQLRDTAADAACSVQRVITKPVHRILPNASLQCTFDPPGTLLRSLCIVAIANDGSRIPRHSQEVGTDRLDAGITVA